jgi:GNAT superfamily N-acetyltransferase
VATPQSLRISLVCQPPIWQNIPVPLEIRDEPYDAAVVQTIIQDMADDLARLYGPGSYAPQDPTGWAAPEGAMVVAYDDGVPVACGGLIRHDADTAELKRMFTHLAHRRRGVARRVLAHLEERARQLGYRRMVLETGVPQTEARSLYLAAGYRPVPCWPPHDSDPTSVCFERILT